MGRMSFSNHSPSRMTTARVISAVSLIEILPSVSQTLGFGMFRNVPRRMKPPGKAVSAPYFLANGRFASSQSSLRPNAVRRFLLLMQIRPEKYSPAVLQVIFQVTTQSDPVDAGALLIVSAASLPRIVIWWLSLDANCISLALRWHQLGLLTRRVLLFASISVCRFQFQLLNFKKLPKD